MANILDKIKLSGITYDIIDATAIHSMDGYWTSGQTTSAITAATAALAETIGEELSGKVDTSAYTAYTAATETALGNKADKTEIPSVSGYADSVKYNSTTKYVEFYHGTTAGTKVFEYDASPFLIDGMVQNVEIKDVEISGETVTCLVISFNTDAGKQDINIPLTEIFDPNNYYTKSQIDTSLSGKQDTLSAGTGIEISANTISVTGVPLTVDQTVISGSTNPVAGGAVYDELQGKQATLVSGTNIKTVGTNSVLGSGNIPLMTARVGTGDDSTTLIFEFN